MGSSPSGMNSPEAVSPLECCGEAVGDDLELGSVPPIGETKRAQRARPFGKQSLGFEISFEIRTMVIERDGPVLFRVDKGQKRESGEIVVEAGSSNSGLGIETDPQ